MSARGEGGLPGPQVPAPGRREGFEVGVLHGQRGGFPAAGVQVLPDLEQRLRELGPPVLQRVVPLRHRPVLRRIDVRRGCVGKGRDRTGQWGRALGAGGRAHLLVDAPQLPAQALDGLRQLALRRCHRARGAVARGCRPGPAGLPVPACPRSALPPGGGGRSPPGIALRGAPVPPLLHLRRGPRRGGRRQPVTAGFCLRGSREGFIQRKVGGARGGRDRGGGGTPGPRSRTSPLKSPP